MSLLEQDCQPLAEGSAALNQAQIGELLAQVSGWQVAEDYKTLIGDFHFKNYYETMAFVNAIAWIAHQEDHHPDLKVSYNHCQISYNTHTVKGLSINDFICAAKINRLRTV